MKLKKMYKRPDLRNENPWVIVDSKTKEIIQEGPFSELVQTKKGNLMTKTLYKQFLDEINL
jgi:hypothetical protein